jgi:hypothetical protein
VARPRELSRAVQAGARLGLEQALVLVLVLVPVRQREGEPSARGWSPVGARLALVPVSRRH